ADPPASSVSPGVRLAGPHGRIDLFNGGFLMDASARHFAIKEWSMHRRQFLAAIGVAAAALSRSVQVLAAEQQTGQDSASRGLLDAFLALPGNKSVLVDIDRPHGVRRVAYQPD